MVTMQDIAERVGVNKGTVSYVLNGKHKQARIGQETCKRIKDIARELGYKPNDLARSVATGKSKVIAFVSMDIGSWEYTAKIMAGMLEKLTAQEFSLKVYHLSEQNSLDISEQIVRQRVDGVIFHSSSSSDFQIIQDEMNKHHIPCATVNITNKNACAGVTTDDFQGVKDAVKHLAELGHQRILYLSDNDSGSHEYVARRRDGYIAGMREYIGESAPVRIEVLPPHNDRISVNDIKKILGEATELRPTAIISVNDVVAMEVLRAAYETGIKVPDELSVIGFADLEMSKYAMVPLTTLAQPFEAMGREVIDLLLNIIKNKPLNSTDNVKNRILKVELKVRESTAPLVNLNR